MGIKYSHQIQLPHNIFPRNDKLLRRFYSKTKKYDILYNDIQYKTYNLIFFFCDNTKKLNYYAEFCKRIVGNENIIYMFKNNNNNHELEFNKELINSEILLLKKYMLNDYGIDLKINKKILLSEGTNIRTLSVNYVYLYNTINKIILLNPILNNTNISIFFNTYNSNIYLIYTKDFNIDRNDIVISIPKNNIIITKTLLSSGIYTMNNVTISQNTLTQWDEFFNIISYIL